ncbi:cell wall hydrolase [Bdellovibrio sp. ArHS]|uniref:cell wall hydrolase n=1 Tax=Bdellovibrio sp. ArHS TaxID=1569284 RepID=UPI0025BADCA2|nr:cell wall hydrolase [Bdellovibrio sp. ArHS]
MHSLAFLLCLLATPLALAQQSSVYTCRFENDPHGFSSVRMKKYFDAQSNMELGKIDLIQNFVIVETTPTKVYQIPLLDNQSYVQLWHSANLRVDAQLLYSQGSHEFRANYVKNSEKQKLICVELRN